MNATATITKVRTSAESRKRPEVRNVGALGTHDYTRQGDVYIWNIPAIPNSAALDKKPAVQIAPGTTQGSRHCVDDLSKVQVYRLQSPNALQGPIIVAPEGFTLTHPEHGHHTFPPGIYAITFQRAYAEELRRVAD